MSTDNKSNFRKILVIVTWIFIILSVFAFYISLRSELYSMQYAVIALVLWIIAMGANYWSKKYKE